MNKYWIKSYLQFEPKNTEMSHWGKGQTGFNISINGKIFLSDNQKVKTDEGWKYPSHRDLITGEGLNQTAYSGIYSWGKENALWLYPWTESALNSEMKKGLASLIGVHKINPETPVKSNTGRNILFRLKEVKDNVKSGA